MRAISDTAPPASARRRFLRLAVGAPVILLALRAAAEGACEDAAAMTNGEQSLRKSLGFRLVSEDPKRVCSGCAFFKATEAPAGCGACALLNGGHVALDSRCDSWSPKPR